MLGLGSNSRLLGKGSKDTLALKAQIIVLERAGTPKKGFILCLPEPSGPCGGRGWGGCGRGKGGGRGWGGGQWWGAGVRRQGQGCLPSLEGREPKRTAGGDQKSLPRSCERH